MPFCLKYFIQAPSPTFARRPAEGPVVVDRDRSRLLGKAEAMMGEYCKAHPEFRPYHSEDWEWLAEPLVDPTAESYVIVAARV